jgi:hypothetical protein
MLQRLRIEITIIPAIAIGASYFLFLVFVIPFMDNTRRQNEQSPPIGLILQDQFTVF